MPTVDVMVNGRRHTLQCGAGEEGRVRQLASYLDRKVTELARGQTQAGDTRMLIMASLMVADELSDAFEEIKQLKATFEERIAQVEQQAAGAVERVAQQLDSIAAELEKA